MYALLLLWILIYLVAVSCFQQKVKITTACSEVDTNVTNNVTEDKSYRIIWTGDYPFNGRNFCKLTFKRAVNEAICIDTITFNMSSRFMYLRYYKNNEPRPFREYHKSDRPLEVCGHYEVVHVEIGGITSKQLADWNHLTIKVHKKVHHRNFSHYIDYKSYKSSKCSELCDDLSFELDNIYARFEHTFLLVGIAVVAITCLLLCIVISCKCAHVRRRNKHIERLHSRTPMLEC